MTMFGWPQTPYREIHEMNPAMTLDQYHTYELERLEEWIRASASNIITGVRDGKYDPISAFLCFKNHVKGIIGERDKREELDFYSEHLEALLQELAPQIYPAWKPDFTERYRSLKNGWFVDDHYIKTET